MFKRTRMLGYLKKYYLAPLPQGYLNAGYEDMAAANFSPKIAADYLLALSHLDGILRSEHLTAEGMSAIEAGLENAIRGFTPERMNTADDAGKNDMYRIMIALEMHRKFWRQDHSYAPAPPKYLGEQLAIYKDPMARAA